MICVDSSSVIAYLDGSPGADIELVDQAFRDQVAVLSPVSVTELLSDPTLPAAVRTTILALPVLPLHDGFWERAGLLRARVIRLRRKARIADVLIAQNCLDNRTPLVTRDRDFRNLAAVARLRLL
jgi:predicted nucleic acid-binding protein